MSQQISLFDATPQPGDWIDHPGRELTFDEIVQHVGRMIVMDKSTESHAWYKVVLVEQIIPAKDGDGRRLVYFDGKRQRGIVSEMFFPPRYTGRFPARAYELEEAVAV